jgi:hypothetical protein
MCSFPAKGFERLPPGDFLDAGGHLAHKLEGADFRCRSGSVDGFKRTVSKNLRWKTVAPTNP